MLTWAWDIYAQAHGIPYVAPDYIRGIILAPYMATVIEKTGAGAKVAGQKAIELLTKKSDPK